MTQHVDFILEGAPFFEEVLDAAIVQLANLVEGKKASLVAGWAYGFEGNHNDTTFLVRLAVP